MTANAPYEYSRGHRLLELAGIAVFLAAASYLSVRIFLTVKGTPDLLMVVACAGVGFLASDVLSGVVHWSADTLFGETTPFIGRRFIRPFREHHQDPRAITHHDFVETNGNNCLATSPVLGAIVPVLPDAPGVTFYVCSVSVFMAWSLFATNQFHKWAHADRVPHIVVLLQRWHLILSPSHHDVHHKAPHDRHYCITVGWMNPLLARVRFFHLLEWAVNAVWPRIIAPHAVQRRQAARTDPASQLS